MQRTKISVFLVVEPVASRSPGAPLRYRAQWIARGTGTRMYTSKTCALDTEAAALAMKYLARNAMNLADTTRGRS